METGCVCSGTVILETFACSMREALVRETALIVEKYLCWLLLGIGSKPNDVLPELCQIGKRISLPLVNRVQKHDAEHGKSRKTEDNVDNTPFENGNQDGDNLAEEDGSYHSDGADEEEDDDADGESGDRGSCGRDEEEDGDDDDGSDYSDSDEEDEEVHEDDDDKGNTTGSESDNETDDDPGFGSLLLHAREIYSSNSFLIFENEYKKTKALTVDVTNEDCDARGLVFEYEVRKSGHHFGKDIRVTALPCDSIVKCSCNYFNLIGILCSHALKVLGCLRIEKIPDQYILKRHTKDGRVADQPCSPTENHEGLGSSANCAPHNRLKDAAIANTNDFKDVLDTHTDYIDGPLLRHAKDIYLSNIFFMFREEYKRSEYLLVHPVQETCEIVFDFEVTRPSRHSGNRQVHAEPDSGRVNCSCKGFETTGILCRHALAVLDCLCIERIPAEYVLEKFMKNPGVGMVGDIHGPRYGELVRFTRYKVLRSLFDRVVQNASRSEEAKRRVTEQLEKLFVEMGCMPDEENHSDTDDAFMIARDNKRARDGNDSQSVNPTDDKRIRKAMGSNNDQTLLDCSNENLEAKKSQTTQTETTGGTSVYSLFPSTSCTSEAEDGSHSSEKLQSSNEFLNSAHCNKEAFGENKNS